MQKNKLIFDFDQTLAYRDGMWTVTIFELLQEMGYTQIDIEDIRKYIRSGFPWNNYEIPHKVLFKKLTWWEYYETVVVDILVKNKINRTEAIRLSKLVRDKYLNIKKWHLYEDTFQALNDLNNLGYECYILSNHVPELEEIVLGLNISQFIQKTYNSAIIGYEKPNSKIYQHVIEDLNVDPQNIIMIGDNYISDITGARSNGIKAIQVRSENEYNYKNHSKDLLGVVPIIKHLEMI